MPAGRPTKYNPEMCTHARRFMLLGKTKAETAQLLGVSEKTMYLWQEEYPEFLQALKEGTDWADAKVAECLFQKATGIDKDPDMGAMVFWLKNRQSQRWRDKREIELPQNPDQAKTIDELEQEILDLTVKLKTDENDG